MVTVGPGSGGREKSPLTSLGSGGGGGGGGGAGRPCKSRALQKSCPLEREKSRRDQKPRRERRKERRYRTYMHGHEISLYLLAMLFNIVK